MMISKIADRHLSREACIYIRQSTMGQVRFNQESTERQYNLASKAQSLGWSSERIRILDRDLGQSGARTTNREDGTANKSAWRSASHCLAAAPWHFGQCRLRQVMVSSPLAVLWANS